MSADPFGRAILDHHRDSRDEPLVDRAGEALLFRLFSVDCLREATVGTPWQVVDSRQDGATWLAVLEK